MGWTKKKAMSDGPFFNKAHERRKYEEEQKDKHRNLSHLGPNFSIPNHGVSKPAYKKRTSPQKRIEEKDGYIIPMEYTDEEKRERAAWLRDSHEGSGLRPEGYVKRSTLRTSSGSFRN